MANVNRGNIATRQAGGVPHRDPVPTQVVTERPVEIKIEAATPADLEGEDEIEEDEESEYEYDDDEVSVEEMTSRTIKRRIVEELRVGVDFSHTRALKRRSAAFEDDTVRDTGHRLDSPRDGTPPKRARMEQTQPALFSVRGPPSPERLKKRNSEELHDDSDVEGRMMNKRPKVDTSADLNNEESSDGLPSSPTSINGSESVEEGDDVRFATIRHLTGASYVTSKPRSFRHTPGRTTAGSTAPRVVHQPDLDQLYTFET